MNPATVPVAILAGVFFASSWALQHAAARTEARHDLFDPRLIVRLCRRPVWLLGRLCAVVGVVVQFMALRLGPLSVVAPLMVTGLVVAVPLEAALQRRRPVRAEVWSVLVTGTGLALFLGSLAPQPTEGDPSSPTWAGVIAVTMGIAGAAALLRLASPQLAAPALGLATGTLFGLAAALLKGAAVRTDSFLGLLEDPLLWSYGAVSLLALTLTQNAFQHGRLATPLVAISLSEPITATTIGLLVLGEHLQSGAVRAVLGTLAAGMVVGGIWKLSVIMSAAEISAAEEMSSLGA